MLANTSLNHNIKTVHQHIIDTFDIESSREYYDNTGFLLAAPTAWREHMFIRMCRKEQKATLKIAAINYLESAHHFLSDIYIQENQVSDIELEIANQDEFTLMQKLAFSIEQKFSLAEGTCKISRNAFFDDKVDLIVDISHLTQELITSIDTLLEHYGLVTHGIKQRH